MNERVNIVKEASVGGKSVLYWMSREQRVEANFALLAAREYATKHGLTLVVAFCVASEFLGASPEAFRFMGEGLMEVERALKAKNIPFKLLFGHPPAKIASFANEIGAGAVFVDFDPLRIKVSWLDELKKLFSGSIYEVDSRNIVPARLASDKKEFAAYTIRPKIHRLLPQFLMVPKELEAQSGAQKFLKIIFPFLML